MSQQVRALSETKSQSAELLVANCQGIIKGLTDNPAFPSPPIDMKTLQAAVDDLNLAIAAQAHGGKAETAEKKNKQEALIVLLRRLKYYVEDNCKNDPAVLLSSGFRAALRNRASSPLGNPSILSVDFGNNTELVLKVTPVSRAKSYEVRAAAIGAGNTQGPWQPGGLFTAARAMRVTGLIPGTTYVFQVRAIGGSTGFSDWSNPVSHMCA